MKGLDSFSYKSFGLYFISFYKLASFYKITKAQVSPSGSQYWTTRVEYLVLMLRYLGSPGFKSLPEDRLSGFFLAFPQYF